MNQFITRQRELHPISDENADLLLQNMEEIHYSAGSLIVFEGKRNNCAFFMKSGFARAYVVRDGKDITLWFSGSGELIIDSPQEMATVSVEIMEDSVLLCIRQERLEVLFEQSLQLANWGRKLLEHYLSEYERYFTTYSWTSASEQYEQLIKSNPDLLQKVPLKHIASYLQITPQSLSRIRAQKK